MCLCAARRRQPLSARRPFPRCGRGRERSLSWGAGASPATARPQPTGRWPSSLRRCAAALGPRTRLISAGDACWGKCEFREILFESCYAGHFFLSRNFVRKLICWPFPLREVAWMGRCCGAGRGVIVQPRQTAIGSRSGTLTAVKRTRLQRGRQPKWQSVRMSRFPG